VRHHVKEKPLIIEVLKRTPPWVFVLFVLLLAAGWLQSKDRVVTRGKVTLLPIAMIALSFYNVQIAFDAAPIALMFWLIGVGLAVPVGFKSSSAPGVTYSPETRLFSVPGSWLPLLLMMTIFFIKYAVAVVTARQLPIAGSVAFMGAISFCYGILSGAFLARALAVWRSARRTAKAMPGYHPHADIPQATQR
jgi:hypothetical protein